MISVTVFLSFKSRSRSSEIRSVKFSVLPISTALRAFLIQKISIIGMAEKPIKVQPIDFLRKRRVIPPANKVKNKRKLNKMTGTLLRACFW